MWSAIKKFGVRMYGLNGFLLIAYLLVVCSADILVSEYFSYKYFLLSFCFIFVLTISLCPMVLRSLSKLSIRNLHNTETINRCHSTILQMAFYLIPFSVFLLYYAAFYPGGFSSDSIGQFEEAITGKYNDWHPVIQTLFAFKLPLTLSGRWIGSISLFQVICFSATLGYSFHTIYKYTNTKFAVAAMVFLLLNPKLCTLAVIPWKDVSFAIGALLLLTYSLQIYWTNGAWIRKPANCILYVVVASLTTLFRHNALLFTVPLVFAVLFYLTPKKSLLICLSILVVCVGIKVPLYNALNVQSPDKRQVETLGLPMTIIGAVVSETPDKLDEDILEFAYRVAPQEVWEEKYSSGSYNSIKWDSRTDNMVIEEYGARNVLSMMFRSFMCSKRVATTAFINLTKANYSLTDEYEYFSFPYISNNSYGISLSENNPVREIFFAYQTFISENLSYPYLHLGFWHFVLLAVILAKCDLRKFRDWKKIFFILPVFAYNYGTALLLTGVEDSTRFFFYTYLLIPVLLIFLFKKDPIQNKEIC